MGNVIFLKIIIEIIIIMRVVVSIICWGIEIVFFIVKVNVIVLWSLEKNIMCCRFKGILCVFLRFNNRESG